MDAHHTVEDVGICLGQAVREALGDKTGISRFGEATIPMDETLVSAAVDFGGRAAFVYRADMLKGRWIGTFDAELAREFFGGFCGAALCNLHLEARYGENAHHIVEALFKACARAVSAACARIRGSWASPRPRGRSPPRAADGAAGPPRSWYHPSRHEPGQAPGSPSPTPAAATCAASRRPWTAPAPTSS